MDFSRLGFDDGELRDRTVLDILPQHLGRQHDSLKAAVVDQYEQIKDRPREAAVVSFATALSAMVDAMHHAGVGHAERAETIKYAVGIVLAATEGSWMAEAAVDAALRSYVAARPARGLTPENNPSIDTICRDIAHHPGDSQ